jgi:anti-anti-sigma regulatory factor
MGMPDNPVNYKIDYSHPGFYLVHLSGRLELYVSKGTTRTVQGDAALTKARAELSNLLKTNPRNIAFDVADVKYISSNAIGFFLSLREELSYINDARKTNYQVFFEKMPANIRKLFEQLGFYSPSAGNPVFQFVPEDKTLEEMVA